MIRYAYKTSKQFTDKCSIYPMFHGYHVVLTKVNHQDCQAFTDKGKVFQAAQRDGNYYVSLSFLLGYTKTIQNTKWNTYAYNPISSNFTVFHYHHVCSFIHVPHWLMCFWATHPFLTHLNICFAYMSYIYMYVYDRHIIHVYHTCIPNYTTCRRIFP